MGSATARIQYQPLTSVGPADEPVPVRVLDLSVVGVDEVELTGLAVVVVITAVELLLVEVAAGVVAVPGTH